MVWGAVSARARRRVRRVWGFSWAEGEGRGGTNDG